MSAIGLVRDRLARRLATGRDDVRVGARVHFALGSRARTGGSGSIRLADGVRLERGALLQTHGGHIELDRDVWIGPYCVLYGTGGLTIGEQSMISMLTTIVASNHTYTDPVVAIRDQPVTAEGVTIGRDVWVGGRSVILDGVSIGAGAVIAAGSVVTQDVPSMAVVAGTPARQVAKRGE